MSNIRSWICPDVVFFPTRNILFSSFEKAILSGGIFHGASLVKRGRQLHGSVTLKTSNCRYPERIIFELSAKRAIDASRPTDLLKSKAGDAG